MTLEQLEKDVAELKVQMAALQAQLSQRQPGDDAQRGILSIVGSMKDVPGFEEMVAYGRYYRLTGKDPPPDWKPGDPIPEPDEEWCPR